jgi:hypothetical protein
MHSPSHPFSGEYDYEASLACCHLLSLFLSRVSPNIVVSSELYSQIPSTHKPTKQVNILIYIRY